ncbi:hypothetical protein AVHY2522_22950 [Acidovorax sp. SUPP2522]|uniref:hypothetical protein n=1 Tax=unclassified Acidovorax TaxID=2684926 RepID=UPI00234B185A|nr:MULTISPECIES: hypothetical protein [unclassified Acidovorax]WCM95715.1 hypothetical protein M5C96_14625 [Acidovorax sp. GBBC 1281]GKT19566.1 hypothetical protein AVHY2522_22950 [Acidovorax sp. SUPP2522]
MDRKTLMVIAAAGAVLVLLRMRSQAATVPAAGAAGSGTGSAGVPASWTSALAGLMSPRPSGNNTKAPPVVDHSTAPAPSSAPAVIQIAPPAAPALDGAAWGGQSYTPAAGFRVTVNGSGLMTYGDGSTHQMTPSEYHAWKLQQ